MAENESTMKWKVDISQLKSAMQDAKRSISLANAEFKAATAGMDKWSNSVTGVEAKLKQLNSTLPQQKSILAQLEQQYKITAENMGENSAEAQRLKIQIENQKASIAKTEAAIGKYNTNLQQMKTESTSLTSTISKQEAELSSLKTAYVDAVAQYGKNSKEAKALASQISSLSGELAENKTKQSEASKEADKLDKSIDGVGESADQTTDDIKELDGGFTVLKGTMANLASQAITGLISGFAQLGKEVINVGKQAIMSYADYEQLVGGVETLFGAGGMSVEEYAKSVGKSVDKVKNEYYNLREAQTTVLQNASDAFETAGLSQNEYMETVTSFSASLISSLGGDTKKAAEYADRAITDMSDNANKMGTSMTDIQNAYQGFAKQNYTMLDNLKLGYGGTKEEMARLIQDASKMKDVQKELGVEVDASSMSFGNIVNAISVMQSSMGIAGTTAKEAASTISGSLNMTKASWSNLLTGMADDSANFDGLINNFVESALTFGKNILPRIQTTIQGMAKMVSGLLQQLLPPILEMLPQMITETLPLIVQSVETVISTVLTLLPQIVSALSGLIPQIVESLTSLLPQLIQSGMSMVASLMDGIAAALPDIINMIPELIQNLVDVIVTNLPLLIESGIGLLNALIEGLMTAIPTLIEYVPQIIQLLLAAFMTNLPLILQAGVNILLSLIAGLTQAIPMLIKYIPTIISSIVTTLMHLLPQILQSGIQILLALINGIVQMMPALVNYIPEIINTILTVLTENLPLIIEMGINTLVSLINGIVEAIPQLMEMLPTLITTIVTVLTQNLPKIIQMGIKILVKLINGLTQALPQLISMLPTIISTIVQVLMENLPLILKMGVDILMELISGIGSVLGSLGEMMLKVGSAILDAVIELPGKMLEIGGNIVEGIWEGISDGYEWIKGKIKGWVGNVTEFIMKLFGIHSPSTVMRDQVGKNLVLGISEGITKNTKSVTKAFNKLQKAVLGSLKKSNVDYEEAGKESVTAFNNSVKKTIENSKNSVKKSVDTYFGNLISASEKGTADLQKQYEKASSKSAKARLKTQIANSKAETKQLKELYNKFGKEVITEYEKVLESATKGVTDKLQTNISNLTSNLQDALDDVQDKITTMQKNFSSYGDLFKSTSDEFILFDLQDQINALDTFNNRLTALKNRGIAQELIDEIAGMDVDEGNLYMNKLLSMSDSELSKYNQLYLTKLQKSIDIPKKFYADQIASIKENYTSKIADAFREAESQITTIGEQVMSGFIKGMSDAKYTNSIKDIAKSITATMKEALGIHSPSKVFEELGFYSGEGFNIGLAEELKDINSVIASAIPDVNAGINGGQNIATSRSVVFNQTINSPKAVDRLTLYRETNSLLFSAKVRLNNV